MKCPKCGKEIANDSLFCENCGEKVKIKKSKSLKKKIIISLCTIFTFCAICGIFNTYRWSYIYDNEIDHWPRCNDGAGTYYILQRGRSQSLVYVELDFPVWTKHLCSTQGKIFACKGEHSGLGAFAFLGGGMISFMTNYSKGGSLIHEFLDTDRTIDGEFMYSDETHIYGLGRDLVCGEPEENVEMLFPSALGQPVRIKNKWRYILIGGEYMFDDEFDDAYPFCYGMARVCKDGRWFYIDRDGHELSIKYEDGNYRIIQGDNFSYDYDLEKAVAKMKLSANGNEFWTKVDYDGICYSISE